jgi:hypothetical protein
MAIQIGMHGWEMVETGFDEGELDIILCAQKGIPLPLTSKCLDMGTGIH